MPSHLLSAEEKALWRRVTRDVRPIAQQAPAFTDNEADLPPAPGATPTPTPAPPNPRRPLSATSSPGTLDGTWDRRLKRGHLVPEMVIDLHGYSLAGAHRALADALDRAIASGVRVMLLVTGKPPRGGAPRGAIRASIGDWLGGSRHASRIAALRNAHPRHGGEGALYLVLRRPAAKGKEPIP